MPRRKIVLPSQGNTGEETADGLPTEQIIHVDLHVQEPAPGVSSSHHHEVVTSGELVTSGDQIYKTVSVINISPDGSAETSNQSSEPASDKRNHSLEALFQAAHLERENISKTDTPKSAAASSSSSTAANETVTWVEVPNEDLNDGTSFLINTGGTGGTVVRELKQLVRMDSAREGHTLLSIPTSKEPASPSSPYQMKSAGVVQPTPSAPFANRSKSVDEVGGSKRLLMLEKTLRSLTGTTITTSVGPGGRKRKHPQKPGKHICPYCNRGCAKPSVLKKHIRAHTGERPYPCEICGFAFKTKSNLYKHCKSRWHQLKLGLMKDGKSASNSEDKEEIMDIEDDEVEEEEEDEEEECDDVLQIVSNEPPPPPIKPEKPVYKPGKSLDSSRPLPTKKGVKRIKSENVPTTSKKLKKQAVMEMDDDSIKKMQSVHLQSGGTVISHLPSNAPTAAIVQTPPKPQMSPHPIIDVRSLSPGFAKTPIKETIPNPVFRIKPSTEDIILQSDLKPSSVLPGQIFHIPSSPASSSHAATSLQLPLKVSPMVLPVKDSPQKVQTMTLSRLGGSLDQKMARLGESSVSSDLSTSVQFSRSTSLNVGGLEVPTQNYHHLNIPKLEQKQMSMEKVMERISHLISQNQAIVSTPMAEPPRRRILRQSSAISPRAMTIAMSGPLTRSVSVTDRPLSNVAPVIPMPSIQSLSKMPSNLSDMQSVSEKVSRNTADMMTRSLSDTQPNSVVSDIILPRSMPETMLHNMPENMTITPIAAKKVEFPDQTVKQNQPILQPVLQLPKSVSNLLSPPSGGQALPRQIKIQFKLPKENIAAKPVQRQSSSLEVPASSIPEVALATQHIPVSDVKEPSAAAKARPQLAAMLQEQKQVEDTKERTETTTEKFVCGVCWYTSNSIEVLRNHTCNETQPSSKVAIPPRSESSVTVISEIEVVTDKEAKSASDMPRPRRVLQRQKNVVVEMVDPRTPPKRGRPKGAKNVLSEPKRPTLQRSQSALEMTAPPKTENIPEELKGEAPQALWKLKLKGHLLMKRSISVERMLSQEKEQQENKAQEGEPDESQLIKQAPLLRSKSYDETVLATQSIKSESVREKLLSKLSRSCHNLTHTQSVEEIDEEDESQMDSDAETKDAVRKIPVIPEVIITEPRPPSVENVTPIIPVNLESTVFFPEKLMYSPHLDVIKENRNRVPSTLSIPINVAHKAPGLLQEAKLTMPEESVPEKDKDKEQTEDMETNDAVQKKRNVCTLHTIQMAGESKQVQNKITATLLMLGHSNPTMNTVTLSTFCCIHKTQPMYVEKRNNQNVSMYSNWRAAPYNPNPKGLNSKLLLDLYQTMRYNVEPRFIQAASEKSLSKMWTHSDYWATREAQFDHETGEDADKAKFARLNAQPDNYPDVSLHKTGTESASAETTKSAAEPTVEVTETSVVTTRDKLKEALTIDKPKRVQIFDGGYKSLEEYVYVRGRGRGKYVCEKCGIRCKKPSMLKKHIRTHTDVRPYHCRHCNFSFKTKGNLTKHMKSKSHHKLCVDLGIVPVPTAVDDNCINPILGAQGGIFYDLDGPDVGHMEEVGDDDDDDDDDDEEDEDDEAMVIEQHNTEEVHPEMLEVEVISHPTKDISNPDQEDSMDDQTIEVVQINDPVEGFTAPKLGNPQASLDKEIAAASLLDLSKVTGSSEKDGNSPQEQDMDVEENDEAISAPPGKMDGPVTAKDIILQSTFRYLKSNNSYAKKIALLQAANSNESQSQDKDRDMSGFAPPLMFRGSDGGDDNDALVTPIQSQQHSDTQRFGPIVGQFLLPDFKAEKPDLKTVISQITSIAASTASSDKSQIAALDPASIDDNVAYVSDEDHAPCEILPIPVGGEETGGDEQGRFVCDVCDKTFSKQQQYSLHKNAHLLERPYRCMDCGLAFQSRMLLDKHQSSERHQTQVALMQKLGASSSEDPRPFKCDECGIAFRIQGHLARHLRSKVHINKLEALTGRSPEYDGAGSNLDSYQVRLVPSESSCLTSASQSLIVETGEDLKAAIPALPTSVEETQPSESTATFKYQPPVEEYEKVVVASNERVTVEIKSEPIELGEIVPKAAASQKRDVDSESTDRHGAGPNKCGICGKTFKDMNSLKRHLVSHAELRPYVCEYCDAGFTTAQSLKFHLRTHTQDCPYMCGHCGATFGRSDLLQNHLTQAHFGIIVDEQLPSNKPVTVVTAPPAPAVQSPPPTIAVPQITVAASPATITAPPLSVAAPPVTIAATSVTVAAPPQPQLISTAVPGQYMIQVVAPPGATPSSNQLQILPTASIPTGQSSVPVVMNSSLDSGFHPGMLPVHPGTLPSASQAEGGSSNSVLELDLHNYEVQEYLERGADGQERVVYMLVVPPSDGDTTRGTDDSPAPQATKHAPTLQEHAMAMSPIFDNDGTTGDDLKPS